MHMSTVNLFGKVHIPMDSRLEKCSWSNEDSRSSILYPPTDQYSMNCPSNKLQLMGVPLVPNAHVYSELVPKNSQSHEFPLGKRFWLESGVLPQAKINISFLFLAYAAIYM